MKTSKEFLKEVERDIALITPYFTAVRLGLANWWPRVETRASDYRAPAKDNAYDRRITAEIQRTNWKRLHNA